MLSSSSAEAGPSRTKPSRSLYAESTQVKLGSTDVADGGGDADGTGISHAPAPTPAVPSVTPSFFPTPALDHAFGGIAAGAVATICMNPLDLLKVKFQVSTRGPEGGVGRGIWRALRDIHASEGLRGLYRGLSPNVAGNATSWGLYFLLCVRSLSLRTLGGRI